MMSAGMDVGEILRDQAAMESQRSLFDSTWQRIADLIDPANAQFQQKGQIQGQRRDWQQFDSTGALALRKFSAAMESLLTPRTQKWHGLAPADPALARRKDVAVYCEEVTRLLFRARYAPASGFTNATGEVYDSLGAYGNGVMFIDDVVGRTLRYRSLWCGEVWVRQDFSGAVDTVHRKLELTARAAMKKWGVAAGPSVMAAAQKSPDQVFEFLHCVKERGDAMPGRSDYRGMPWASYYISIRDQQVVEESGYWSMPYAFTRFRTAAREVYGRGPASDILPTLNTINEQQKTMLRAGQRAVDPPIMTVDDDALETFSLRAGSINAGYLSGNGQALAIPFQSGMNLPIGIEMVQDSRNIVNDAFFVNLFQVLVERPEMTATEAMLRAQEKGELLGPSVGRQQQEFLSKMIERELSLLSRIPGMLPEMPDALREAGGLVEVKYSSPLNLIQRSGEAVAIMRTMEALTPMAQIDPGVLDGLDMKAAARILAEVNGVPAEVLRSAEDQQALEEAKAQEAQAQQLLQAAPVAGKTALDMAKAQQITGANPIASLLGG